MNLKTFGIISVILAVVVISGNMYSQISSSGAEKGGYQVDLTTNPNPLKTGNGTFIISVKDTQGNPVKDAKVNFSLDMVTMHHGSQTGEAASQGDGRYAANAKLFMRGNWQIKTKINIKDGKQIEKDFTVTAN